MLNQDHLLSVLLLQSAVVISHGTQIDFEDVKHFLNSPSLQILVWYDFLVLDDHHMQRFLECWINLVLPIVPEYMELGHSQLVHYLHHTHLVPDMEKKHMMMLNEVVNFKI